MALRIITLPHWHPIVSAKRISSHHQIQGSLAGASKEEQQKKSVAYTQALQCWAERANPPMPGQPCLLVESLLELCKMMEQYVSFSDDIILGIVALPEGFFGSQTSTDVPSEEQLQVELAKWDSSLPESLEPTHMVALPPGFEEVTACLQGDPSPTVTLEVPLECMQPEAFVKPAVATMCASCVVQDKVSRVTYMETFTTSLG